MIEVNEASEVSEVYGATEVTLTEVTEVIEATKVSETLGRGWEGGGGVVWFDGWGLGGRWEG